MCSGRNARRRAGGLNYERAGLHRPRVRCPRLAGVPVEASWGQRVPLIAKRDGRSGVYDATIDPEQIKAWWTRTPDANIGLACGSYFWVLDVDYAGWTTVEPDGLDTHIAPARDTSARPRP